MRHGRPRRARGALLIAAFSLPVSHTALAVDIHYARAIGDTYEYRPPAPGTPDPAPPASDSSREPGAPPPERTDPVRGEALPGLGTEASAPAAEEGARTWPRVLIGVLIVGAMAALASKGGGGEGEVQVNTGVDLGGGAPSPPTPPPTSSGGNAPPSGDGGGAGSPSAPPSSGGGTTSGGGSGGSSGPVVVVGGGESSGSSGKGKSDDKKSDDKGGKKGKK